MTMSVIGCGCGFIGHNGCADSGQPHQRLIRGYDEPGILSYAISSFCPTSADGLHIDISVQCEARAAAFDHEQEL
jgi:hypothetical protein